MEELLNLWLRLYSSQNESLQNLVPSCWVSRSYCTHVLYILASLAYQANKKNIENVQVLHTGGPSRRFSLNQCLHEMWVNVLVLHQKLRFQDPGLD